MIKRSKAVIQKRYWYHVCLGMRLISYPVGMYLRLTYPNWGRTKRMNPSRNPDTNPPTWAELSTRGRNPTPKFMPIITTRVTSAAHWSTKLAVNYDLFFSFCFRSLYSFSCILLYILTCMVSEPKVMGSNLTSQFNHISVKYFTR